MPECCRHWARLFEPVCLRRVCHRPAGRPGRLSGSSRRVNSDATLLVVARERPQRGEWIEVRKGQGTGAIIAACRKAIGGRDLSGAAIHATRQGGEWRMRMAGFVIAGRALRIYNDNLDHFPVGSTRILWRHVKWRWSQRPRGAIWWNALAKLAMASGARNPSTPIDDTQSRRFSSTAPAPGISVVIPSRDGRDLIAGMLPAVLSDLRALPVEVIIVDNGSSDGTSAFLLKRIRKFVLSRARLRCPSPKPSTGGYRPRVFPRGAAQ